MNQSQQLQNNPQHKIAALLAAVHAGEVGTVEQKDYCAGVIAARIEKHNGVVLESSDCGIVAEFEETASAVNCAIDIQSKLAEHNQLHLDVDREGVRMGIHYGEIFFSEGKLIGNGINAVRGLVETVPPSKIYITREGFRRVRAVLQLKTETIGTKSLPHTSETAEVFSILWESVKADMEASLKQLEKDDFHRTAITLPQNAPAVSHRKKSPMIVFVIIVIVFLLLRYFHVI
jgi:class 3 adenylate cyclase